FPSGKETMLPDQSGITSSRYLQSPDESTPYLPVRAANRGRSVVCASEECRCSTSNSPPHGQLVLAPSTGQAAPQSSHRSTVDDGGASSGVPGRDNVLVDWSES
ncbi:MAG TPA: hypothetical protein VMM77_00715, partial [Gemmatimonadaceae bacterium]|nr:hypothetical protein [Gemmatimonadaceae bacterium]